MFKITSKRRNEVNKDKFVVDFYMSKEIKNDAYQLFEKEFEKTFSAINMKFLYNNILKLFLNNKNDIDENQ